MSTEKNATEKSAAKHSVLTLRVAEAQTKDATRGIARLDPADLARIGATIGDVISIQGDKKTVVKAMKKPAATEPAHAIACLIVWCRSFCLS